MATTTPAAPATEHIAVEACRAALSAAKRAEELQAPMWTSAKEALRCALLQVAKGDYRCARSRALDSLAYSCGKFSPAYQAVASLGGA